MILWIWKDADPLSMRSHDFFLERGTATALKLLKLHILNLSVLVVHNHTVNDRPVQITEGHIDTPDLCFSNKLYDDDKYRPSINMPTFV